MPGPKARCDEKAAFRPHVPSGTRRLGAVESASEVENPALGTECGELVSALALETEQASE